jgi:hypothetical protein
LKLLERWRAARERFVSLSTEIEVVDQNIPRTAESRTLQRRQQDTTLHFQVLYRRPGKARIVAATVAGGGGFRRVAPLNGTAVSDGERVTFASADGNNSAELRNPNRLLETLVRLGMRTQYDAVGVLFNQPPAPENFDKVTYDGTLLLEGREPVESVTLHRLSEQRNGQYLAETTIQYLFASDGLPRVVETKNVANMSGRLERDQPPIQTIDVRFVNLALDFNPPSTAFAKP